MFGKVRWASVMPKAIQVLLALPKHSSTIKDKTTTLISRSFLEFLKTANFYNQHRRQKLTWVVLGRGVDRHGHSSSGNAALGANKWRVNFDVGDSDVGGADVGGVITRGAIGTLGFGAAGPVVLPEAGLG